MKYIIIIALIALSISSYAQTSGKFKIYKLQSNFINGSPSSIPVGTGEGVAIVDSNGVFVRKVPPSVLGLPTGTVYRIARFTGVNTVTNTTSLVDSAGFYGLGQIDGSGLQNARLNITVQNSSSSGIGLILKNTNGDLFGTIKNTGSFSFGVTSALDWDEVNTKLTANSPFQFGTSTNQPLYFSTNGSIRTALDATAFTVNVPVDNTADSYSGIARGTTAQRPTATFSRVRANSDSSGIEYADGAAWQLIASRNWVRSNFGGSPTTIYNGDGTISANRNINANNTNITWQDVNSFRINYDVLVFSKADATFPFSSIISGADSHWQFAFTPIAGVFSKGNAMTVDTNNNVSLGVSTIPINAPLYSSGGSGYVFGFQSGGANYYKVSNVTTSGNVSITDHFITIDATAGAVTLTLPAASVANSGGLGIDYIFKRLDNSGNTITIQRAGSDTIDGATSFTLTAQYESKSLRAISSSSWALY